VAEIEINDLATQGNVRDLPGYQLPPEAFTEAQNVRFYDEGVQSVGGRPQIFGTPGVAPHFVLPVTNAAQGFWLYTSLTKAYVYDGTTHTNITRQTASVDVNYTAANTRDWNGTLLGDIPILNNGADVPQFWASLNTGTKLAALTNWPSTHRAAIMRSFGPYLMGFNITISGTNYPHRVKWSHPADPGSLPNSWDETDPDFDAGEQDLVDMNAGIILEAMTLGGRMFVYKEGSIWRVSNLASSEFQFDFKTFVETVGVLAPRCVAMLGDGLRHAVATQDDIIVHNGVNVQSVLDKKYKRYLFNQIDTSNYRNSFLFTNPAFNEIWFCFPEAGSVNATRAVIFNYKEGGISETEISFQNAMLGTVETSDTDTWATTSGTWDTDDVAWSVNDRRKIVLADPSNTKFFMLDSGTTFDGSPINITLSRDGLGVVGRKRNGDWIVDFSKMKFVHRLWLKASGGVFQVRMGFADTPEGTITWTAAQQFDPATQKYLDFAATGRALAIEFTSTNAFRLEGYKLVGDITGAF